MSKLTLLNEEKDQILQLHNEVRLFNLFEQQAKTKQEALTFFKNAQTEGCLVDKNLNYEQVFSRQGTTKVYIKGVSPTTKNVKRIFDDYTWEVVDPTGKQLSSGRWVCQAKKKEEPKPPTPEENLKKYLDEWRDELVKSGQTIDNVKTELDASEVVKQDWDKWPIPGSEGKFGKVKFLYINPGSRGKVTTSSQQAQEQSFSDLDKKKCIGIIENYFEYYRTKPTGFSDSWFQNNKPKVQFCKNSFYKKWGITPKAGRLNNIIELMTRQIDQLDNVQSPPLYPEPGKNKHMWKLD